MLHDNNSYHGGGWVASLQQLVAYDKSVSLAIAFLSDRAMDKLEQDGVVYYPINKERPTAIQKLRYYYGGYKRIDHSLCVERVKDVIGDFKPDVIHCFGMETPLVSILGQTDIPVVVHLQGVLSAYSEAFFPPGINKFSFLWPVTIREYVLRNNTPLHIIVCVAEPHTKKLCLRSYTIAWAELRGTKMCQGSWLHSLFIFIVTRFFVLHFMSMPDSGD